jgi:hypothetical protein
MQPIGGVAFTSIEVPTLPMRRLPFLREHRLNARSFKNSPAPTVRLYFNDCHFTGQRLAAAIGDEHDAIIAVWLHGLRQNEGEE